MAAGLRGAAGGPPGRRGRGATPDRQPQRDHRRGRGRRGRAGRRGHRAGQHRGQPARHQGSRARRRVQGHGRDDRRDHRARRASRRRGPVGDQLMTTVLSGRELAADIRAGTAERAAELTALGRGPRLAVVTATTDEASVWYVRQIATAAGKVGIACDVTDLTPDASEDPEVTAARIEAALSALSGEPAVHGIILQTPLPGGARLAELAAAIDPAKDVDGANPVSLGRLMTGLPAFAPATAEAVLRLLDHHGIDLAGQHAVVVGRSAVVGKPVAHLLLDRNATVTICHSRTRDLAAITTTADVLVVAAGRAGLIGPEHVAAGATVIDVGTNTTDDGKPAGDVDPKVAEVAGALSPVPGGVGPVTTAVLLRHVAEAAGG